MKILKIKLKNINSLKGEHELDFSTSPLVETGLILITGPTGSGKSTLLDSITLGLFGNVPRLQKMAITNEDIANLGTILTHHTKEASVEVFFEIKGIAYVSKWSVKLNRNNTLNAIEMQLANAMTNEIIEEKKNNVIKKNEDLIGLSYEQFQKAILLSQGDFAKFLQSKNEDRLKLLEKMIGTDIYRKIGKEAFDYYKAFDTELKMNQNIVESYNVKSEDEIANSKNRVEELSKNVIKIEEELKFYSVQKQNIENLLIIRNKLSSASNNFLTSQQKLEDLKPKLEIIKKHDDLLNFHDDIKQYREIKKTSLETEVKINTLNNNQFTLRKDKEILVGQTLAAFPSKGINSQDFTGQLSDLKTELDKINTELNLVKVDLKSKQDNLINSIMTAPKDYVPWDVKQLGVPLFKEHLERRLKELNKLFTAQDISTQISTSDLSENLIQLDNRKNQCNDLKEISIRGKQYAKDFENYNCEIALATEKIIECDAEAKTSNIQKEALQAKLSSIENNIQKMIASRSLEEARSDLQDGEPCPLCGSLDHPYVTHSIVFEIGTLTIAQNDVKNKIQELDIHLTLIASKKSKNEGAIIHMKSALEKLNLQLVGVRKEYSNLSNLLGIAIDNIEEELQIIDTKKNAISIQIRNLDSIRFLSPLLDLTKDLVQQKMKEMELLDKLKLITPIDLPSKLLDEVIAKNEKLKKDFNICNTGLKIAIDDLETYQNTLAEINTKILSTVQAKGYQTIEDTYNSILDQREVDSMYEEIKNIEQASRNFEKEVIDFTNEKINLELLTSGNFTLDEVNEQIVQKGSQNKNYYQEIGEINGMLNINAENLMLRSDKMVKIEQQSQNIKKWRLLADLIGDASGKRYSNFAQTLTLDRILDIANRRLRGFTDRYSLVRYGEDLFIIDHYMADKQRNVRTLSGGETFIVSLALALGLSDLASQNVKLECLFIDEGFGTLDEDTLDLVVTTLEKLQQDTSKTIGIISHIDYLKERISTQIQLEKFGNGISTFRIVA